MLNATKWVVEPIVRFTLNLGNILKDIECVCYIEKFFTSNVLYLLVFQKIIKKNVREYWPKTWRIKDECDRVSCWIICSTFRASNRIQEMIIKLLSLFAVLGNWSYFIFLLFWKVVLVMSRGKPVTFGIVSNML